MFGGKGNLRGGSQPAPAPQSSLAVWYRALYTQKRDKDLAQIEDAFAFDGVPHIQLDEADHPPDRNGWIDPQGRPWRVALADGAAEGGFSAHWAQMLVDHVVWNDERDRGTPALSPDLVELREWLNILSRQWYADYVPALLSVAQPGTPKFGRMQHVLRVQGQGSTLVVLEIDAQAQRWRAVAIGDSFVFHVRETAPQHWTVQPVRPNQNITSAQFDTHPVLISTDSMRQDQFIWDSPHFDPQAMFVDAPLQPNDVFLLMSDALAKWFLHMIVENPDQDAATADLQMLLGLRDNNDFATWVTEQRDRKPDDPAILGNDDTTLLTVTFTDYQSPSSQPLLTPLATPVRWRPPTPLVIPAPDPASDPVAPSTSADQSSLAAFPEPTLEMLTGSLPADPADSEVTRNIPVVSTVPPQPPTLPEEQPRAGIAEDPVNQATDSGSAATDSADPLSSDPPPANATPTSGTVTQRAVSIHGLSPVQSSPITTPRTTAPPRFDDPLHDMPGMMADPPVRQKPTKTTAKPTTTAAPAGSQTQQQPSPAEQKAYDALVQLVNQWTAVPSANATAYRDTLRKLVDDPLMLLNNYGQRQPRGDDLIQLVKQYVQNKYNATDARMMAWLYVTLDDLQKRVTQIQTGTSDPNWQQAIAICTNILKVDSRDRDKWIKYPYADRDREVRRKLIKAIQDYKTYQDDVGLSSLRKALTEYYRR